MSRIQNGCKAIGEYFRLKRHFGDTLAAMTLCKHFVKPGGENWKSLDYCLNQKCVELLKQYADPESYPTGDASKPIGRDCPIWVYWAQGMDQAPEIIRLCSRKVEENGGRHPVIFLSQENLKEYVQMPEIFEKRLSEGCFGYTHYSDLLRVCLLRQQGGLYLDAGMLLTRPLPEEWFDLPFFTVNHGQGADWLIGRGLWIAGVLGTAKDHPMTVFVQDLLERYWRHNRILAGYLLFDDALRLCFDLFPEFQKQVITVPPSCPGVFDMIDHYGESYQKEFFDKTIRENPLLRLSYKLPTLQGRDTNYHHLLTL